MHRSCGARSPAHRPKVQSQRRRRGEEPAAHSWRPAPPCNLREPGTAVKTRGAQRKRKENGQMERLLMVMVGPGAHRDVGHRKFRMAAGEPARQACGARLDAGPWGSRQDCCPPEARPCVDSAVHPRPGRAWTPLSARGPAVRGLCHSSEARPCVDSALRG